LSNEPLTATHSLRWSIRTNDIDAVCDRWGFTRVEKTLTPDGSHSPGAPLVSISR